MTSYIVLKKQKCEVCEGLGVVRNKLFDEFYEELKDVKFSQLEAYISEWFRKRGYDKPPQEELDCAACEGKGFQNTEIELEQALRELGILDRMGRRDLHTWTCK